MTRLKDKCAVLNGFQTVKLFLSFTVSVLRSVSKSVSISILPHSSGTNLLTRNLKNYKTFSTVFFFKNNFFLKRHLSLFFVLFGAQPPLRPSMSDCQGFGLSVRQCVCLLICLFVGVSFCRCFMDSLSLFLRFFLSLNS